MRDGSRLKHVANLQAGGTPDTGDPTYWADDEGTPWIAISDMSQGGTVVSSAKAVSDAGIASKRLPVGDPGTVLLAMYATVGAAATLGIRATWNQAILGIVPDPARADARFLRYWLESVRPDWTAAVRSNTQDNLNAETVGNAVLPPIPATRQRAIADYLDAETARIDALVVAYRQQLDFLARRKRATASEELATHSIARVPVRRLVTTVTSGPRGWSGLEVERSDQIFLRIANVPPDSTRLKLEDVAFISAPGGDESKRCRVRSGDVLTTITAAIGQVAVVPPDLGEAYVSQHLALLRPNPALVTPDWLALALWSDDAQRQLDAARYGGTKQQLSLDDVRDVRVPLADLKVQNVVLPRLLVQLEALTDAERRIRRVTDLLTERRQAVITAAVTGQLDIPGVAA